MTVHDQQQLVVHGESEAQRFMPAVPVALVIQRRQSIVDLVQQTMVEATEANNFQGDFGIIPGTKQKSLLNQGADKLNLMFGLTPRFTITMRVEDWTGEDHAGEPLFAYEVTCRLYRGDHLMGEGIGSCSSWESKYRYRKSERTCPQCGSAAIIRGKAEYGGGWLCFAKKGGCGQKYKDGDSRIEGQETGRKPNPEIHDQANTILKMACKRAKIAATLNATSAHEFFSQDMAESMQTVQGTVVVDDEPSQPQPQPPPAPAPEPQSTGDPRLDYELLQFVNANREQRIEKFARLKAALAQTQGDEGIVTYYQILKDAAGVEHAWQCKSMNAAKKAFVEMYMVISAGVPVEAEAEGAKP